MIFKRFLRKRNPRHFRMRVESCISTILDLDKKLGEGTIKREIVQQFERLKDSLRYVTDETVDENDIHRIEEATNQLLAEIRVSCEGGGMQLLNKDQMH